MQQPVAHSGFVSHWLGALLGGMHGRTDIPLRLVLWDGSQYDFGRVHRVTVKLPGPGALRHFSPPSLDNLAEGYINGKFEVDGSVQDVVDVAMTLADAAVPKRGRFGRLIDTVTHTRHQDACAIAHHYDVSNDFYRQWLDDRMVYSCAYFANRTEPLVDAQLAKLDHILNKLMLKPGERLLDIGCGWGALVIHAAKQYGARALGVTLSRQQYQYACERVREENLTGQVEIRLLDYRDLGQGDGLFDKIASVGMFEHVGINHLGEYFSKINSLLKEGGLALNHGITSTDSNNGSAPLGGARFISKYVFPDGELPHISQVLKDMQVAGLEVLDAECLRRHYARTLELWAQNYEQHATSLRSLVDETTFRVWRIYLAGCAQAFHQNWVSLYQVLACKAGTSANLNPTPWSRAYMYAPRSTGILEH